MGENEPELSKYDQIMSWIFEHSHHPGDVQVPFSREQLVAASDSLGFPRVKNLGDIPYSYRFRRELPDSIRTTASAGSEWIIVGAGIGQYAFRLASPGKIEASPHCFPVKIPDATPEIVRQYAPGTDEQALLTRVRYNRLADIFLGLTCYSIQSHLRTTVTGIGQVEVDEIYVGLNKKGAHFVVPCQAKSPKDKFGIAQVMQDSELCQQRYPVAICRPLALQFTAENSVAILELAVREQDDILMLNTVDEKHYELVHRSSIMPNDLKVLREHEITYGDAHE